MAFCNTIDNRDVIFKKSGQPRVLLSSHAETGRNRRQQRLRCSGVSPTAAADHAKQPSQTPKAPADINKDKFKSMLGN